MRSSGKEGVTGLNEEKMAENLVSGEISAHRATGAAQRTPRAAHSAPRTAHSAPGAAHSAPRTAHGFRRFRVRAGIAVAAAVISSAAGIAAFPPEVRAAAASSAASYGKAFSASVQADLSTAAKKNGLRKIRGKYYYFRNGKKVRGSWMTIRGYRYYFGKNGAAAVGSRKIGRAWYIFSAKGRLFRPNGVKIVRVNGVRYRVKRNGKAAPGWSAGRTFCFGKNGRILKNSWAPGGKYYLGKNGRKVTGIRVIRSSGNSSKQEKFYVFNSGGALNKEKTAEIQAASVYEAEMTDLYALIGEPIQADYSAGSCYRAPNGDTGGRDGVLKYRNFTVYTYRTSDGSAEYYLGADPA